MLWFGIYLASFVDQIPMGTNDNTSGNTVENTSTYNICVKMVFIIKYTLDGRSAVFS